MIVRLFVLIFMEDFHGPKKYLQQEFNSQFVY